MMPSEQIKDLALADSHRLKYVRINMDYPNLAGKFSQLARAQSRLIESQMRVKNLTPAQKELLVGHAELIEVGCELVKWTHAILTEVGKDAAALTEGARMRDELGFAQTVCMEYMDKRNSMIDKLQAMLVKK